MSDELAVMLVQKFVRACASVARPARANISATLQENVSFGDFYLSSATTRGVADVLKLTTPTQAQAAFIPAAVSKSFSKSKSTDGSVSSSSSTASGSTSGRFVTRQKHFFLQAPNGTGKTVACLIPLLEKIFRKEPENDCGGAFENVSCSREKTNKSSKRVKSKSKVPKALVICPSWELVWQMGRCLDELSTYHGYKVACFTGGEETESDLHTLSFGADVIVATPGRLAKLIESASQPWHEISYILCDEADRILSQRNLLCVGGIVSKIRSQGADPQLVFTSATVREAVLSRAQDLVLSDVQVGDVPWPNVQSMSSAGSLQDSLGLLRGRNKVAPELANYHEDADGVREDIFTVVTCPPEIFKRKLLQEYVYVKPEQVAPFLYETLLNAVRGDEKKVVVFCQSSAMAQLCARAFQTVSDNVSNLGDSVFCIHGDMRQWSRAQQYRQFELSKAAVLFSSDAVTRGMDFPGVGLVVQLGSVLEGKHQYSHRVGRTARAGREGRSLLILNDEIAADVTFLTETLAPIENIEPATVTVDDIQLKDAGQIFGNRTSDARYRLQSEYSEQEEYHRCKSNLQELGTNAAHALLAYYQTLASVDKTVIIAAASRMLAGFGLQAPHDLR